MNTTEIIVTLIYIAIWIAVGVIYYINKKKKINTSDIVPLWIGLHILVFILLVVLTGMGLVLSWFITSRNT
ncbi:hypothetical protein N356_gp111 [Cellulophaga phage phi14:2]|uniref:Uncharacterized protein n=1 Tax=Cellulophaga phage phi14:2 TaxID=1327990 RepID=S0A453_9CAUD|nr:hypothetical protein N356_gp111 [Cellulophaga phage phi14:2]AGO49008.1 hypothetical protein Phi14:2_gp130 [Cellulophaga phage phi14:2]